MRIHSRQWFIGVAVAVAIAGTAAIFAACHRGVGPCSFHSRFHGHPTPEKVLEAMDRKVEDLRLTVSQQAVYDRMREELKADLDRFAEGRAEFREEIRREMAERNPDPKAVATRMKAGMDRLHALMADHLDRMVGLYEVLDDAQKQQVLDHMRGRMDRCGS